MTLAVPRRGDKRRLVGRILAAAREALGRRISESASQRQLLEGVATAFGLEGPLNRIEVYDNSHIQGRHAVGAMIVAGPDGLIKNAYRKFTIRGPKPAGPHPPSTSADGPPSPAIRTGNLCANPLLSRTARSVDAVRRRVGNLRHIGGDDFAMMREVFRRRFGRALKEDPERIGACGPIWC